MIKTVPIPASRSARSHHDRRGFALLITITLLAFLVLLLVSLASLTRVETQVASNNQQLSQARQNALFGLNVALGQLQKYAGPDQRTTVRADFGTGSGAGGNNLPIAVNGARHWTAVLGNTNPSTNTTAAPAILNWLVSGNESASFTASNAAATFGQITATPSGAGAIARTPDAGLPAITVPANSAEASSAALNALTVGTNRFQLLVGYNTVGSTATADQYVVAPLVPINVEARQLPGFAASDTTATPVGRYAYWVGDEGIKAKFNIALSDTAANAAAGSELNQNLLAAAPRAGVERVTGFSAYAAPGNYLATVAGGTGDQTRAEIRQTLSPPQIPLFSGGTIPESSYRPRYHDVTTYGSGVLADQLRGGLRLDLSRGLATGSALPAGNIVTTAQNIDGTAAGVFSTQDQSGFGLPPTLPPWAVLRSYYNTRYDGATPVVPRTQTSAQHGVHPLIASVTLNLGYGTYGAQKVRFRIAPVVNLWNPYNVPLAASDYVVQYRNKRYNTTRVRLYFAFPSGGPAPVQRDIEIHSTNFFPDTDATSSSTRGYQFRINGAAFAPGEVRQFSLSTDVPYNNGVTLTDHNGAPAEAYTETDIDVPTGANLVRVYTFPGAALTSAGEYNQFEFYASINLVQVQSGGTLSVLQKADESNTVRGSVSGDPFNSFNVIAQHHVLKTPGDTYNFQIDGGNNGGVRALADLNIRARYSNSGSAPGWNRNPLWHNPTASNVVVNQWPGSSPASSGSVNGVWGPSSQPSAEAFVSLFDLPRRDLLSLGQLQHAQLISHGTVGSYAIGNSYTNPFVIAGNQDLSFALNLALWDRYYFSSVPSGLTQGNLDDYTYTLPNSRILIRRGETAPPASDLIANGYDRAASRLMINGVFNINSTSIQAWRAQLATLNGLELQIFDTAASATPSTLTPPSSTPTTVSAGLTAVTNPALRTLQPNGDNTAPWRGFRTLSAEQLDALASRIVDQVRARGPFLSLAHFVNRRLTDNDSGALQVALDEPVAASPELRVNPPPIPAAPAAATSTLPVSLVSAPPTNKIRNRDAMHNRPRATLAPGWLSQADLMTSLGPVISARSDTFVIRSYGEAVNPLDSNTITGRAWCEVVVQRLPEYVDSASPNQEAWRAPSSVSSLNQTMGRRFQVISFRWLSPEDI